MAQMRYRIQKLADAEVVLPGFAGLWKAIKAISHTRQRCPKSLVITDAVEPPCPNDYDCAKRFAVDIKTMTVVSSVHLSCGEWATLNQRGEDRAVDGIPDGMAVVTFTYNDYYRSSTLEFQVAAGAVPAQLPECAEGRPFTDVDMAKAEPFCACGRIISRCDGSRRGCKTRTVA